MNVPGSPKVLILYASTHGQTEKIVSKLAVTLGLCDLQVAIRDVHAGREERPDAYDAIVVAASVHAGHHQREIVNWVHHNIDELAHRPNAFISVSLSSADADEEARANAIKYIEDFIRDTRWRPDRSEPVAGALLYREYNPFTRTLVKLIARSTGHETDTSRDYEFTDWEAIARLGQELSAEFKRRLQTLESPTPG